MKRLKLLFLLGFLFIKPLQAYDVFHPEADKSLQEEGVWSQTLFKKNSTISYSSFRVWFPFPAEVVWEVLIDTNAWKDIHSEFTDSRSLDANQFNLVSKKQPDTVKGFYGLIGDEIFPSQYGRQKGKNWISYAFQRFNLPWPLSDRWFVVKVKNDETNQAKGEYRYEYKMYAGNVKSLTGYWALTPIPNKPGWTEFRGEYENDPGISVPQFLGRAIFNKSVRRNAEENTEVMRKKFPSQEKKD